MVPSQKVQVMLSADMWARVQSLARSQGRSVSSMTAVLVEQAMLDYDHLETDADFLAKALQDIHGISKEKAERIAAILQEKEV